jgi:hypothetical protein
MKPELRGIEAKLDRAAEHLNMLDREVRKFIERQTHRVIGEYQPDARCHSFKMAITEQPPLAIGVILGDVVHNLRSALDHLVWQLVLKANRVPGDWTRFPLYDDPGKFAKAVTTPGQRSRRNPLLGLEGTPPLQAIEALQPYHGQHANNLLGALHSLSNEDKHRVVLRTVTGVRAPTSIEDLRLARNADAGTILRVNLMVGVPLEDGTEVLSVSLDPVGPNPEVIMKGNLTLDIAFGEGATLGTVLPDMADAVADLILDFEQRFF